MGSNHSSWPERCGPPPRCAAHSGTCAVLATTFVVCVIPIFTGEVAGVGVKTGDIKGDEQPFEVPIVAGFLMIQCVYTAQGLARTAAKNMGGARQDASHQDPEDGHAHGGVCPHARGPLPGLPYRVMWMTQGRANPTTCAQGVMHS